MSSNQGPKSFRDRVNEDADDISGFFRSPRGLWMVGALALAIVTFSVIGLLT